MTTSQATIPVTVCDCGHAATPDRFTPGYAVDADGRTVCYSCAAAWDLGRLAALKPGDPPVLVYIKGTTPRPHSRAAIRLVTWAGVQLGAGHVYRGDKEDTQMRVTARIDGRFFWGRTPTFSGNYTQLRPYRNQRKARA